jgi:cell division protein FtsL
MKLVLLIGAVLLVAATVFADYKWRRWMAERRRERDAEHDRHT